MKKMKKGILIIFGLLFLFSMCYYDNEEQLNINIDNSCDTANVTFSGTIYPIMSASCIGCHGENGSGGYDLRTYDAVKQDIDKIIGGISYAQGFIQMPMGTPKFDDCKIRKFVIWKENSMPNN
jgi:hypothetical protein